MTLRAIVAELFRRFSLSLFAATTLRHYDIVMLIRYGDTPLMPCCYAARY